jgi:phosphoglycolate phosphatase-like HAD superfamily hydrolase
MEHGLRLAIVTGKGARIKAISLRDLGLDGLFDVVETGAPSGSIKSDAIRKVLARWDTAPARAAYVGDAPGDIQAARAVGLLPVAVAWDACSSAEALAGAAPHALFTRVEEFRRWIEVALETRPNGRLRGPTHSQPDAIPTPEQDRTR